MAQALPLNDSGSRHCVSATGAIRKPCAYDDPQGQDAHYGRDAAAAAGELAKTGAGSAGFDFSKVGNAGQVVAVDATLGQGPQDWVCTRDNHTGLLWEVKLDNSSHPRHFGHTFTWYKPGSSDGAPGSAGDTSSCNNSLSGASCNTSALVAAVNASGLCGRRDWRVPSRLELQSIVDFGRTEPAVDQSYFPNSQGDVFVFYWTDTPFAGYVQSAWDLSIVNGASSTRPKSGAGRVWLVSGGSP